MPFWHNGYLYIPGNIFTGMVRQTLGVTFTYVESENTAILYQDNNNRFLVFNLGLSYTVDGEGQYSYPGGVYVWTWDMGQSFSVYRCTYLYR